jgi:hypothetical protein
LVISSGFVKALIQDGKRIDGFSDGDGKALIRLALRRIQAHDDRRAAYLDNLRDGIAEISPYELSAQEAGRDVG